MAEGVQYGGSTQSVWRRNIISTDVGVQYSEGRQCRPVTPSIWMRHAYIQYRYKRAVHIEEAHHHCGCGCVCVQHG